MKEIEKTKTKKIKQRLKEYQKNILIQKSLNLVINMLIK